MRRFGAIISSPTFRNKGNTPKGSTPPHVLRSRSRPRRTGIRKTKELHLDWVTETRQWCDELLTTLLTVKLSAQMTGRCEYHWCHEFGKQNRKWKIGCIICINLGQMYDQLITFLPPNESRGSNGSELVCFDPFCVLIGWRSFARSIKMKVSHVLRQSALFKPNHSNWSYYLQLYFEIIIVIYNFCNGKVNWEMIWNFVRNIDHGKKWLTYTHLLENVNIYNLTHKGKIIVIVHVHCHMTITVPLVNDCVWQT